MIVQKLLNMRTILCRVNSFDITKMAQKFYDVMNNKCIENLISKLKLRSYIIFNQNVKVAGYLKIPPTRSQRSLFALLRLGILPLAVETCHI